MQGTIESLNKKKDSDSPRPTFGFIRSDEGETFFFIPTSMQAMGNMRFDELQAGMRVEFTPIDNPPKGWRAIEVRVVNNGSE